jgi:hypothetical protein
MPITLTGRVLFQNHLPAQDVEVRVFDRDDPEKVDDDLTISPGKTDASGFFKVKFDPALFQDLTPIKKPGEEVRYVKDLSDIYIPYARFSYQIDGQERVLTSPILRFRRDYILPESKPLQIDPLKHAFAFPNRFPGYALPFRLPNFPGIKEVDSIHGLCGGIAAAIYDFYLCSRPIPDKNEIPQKGTPLYRYLYKRQMQTYGMIGETVIKFGEWMLLPNEGINSIQYRTFQSLENIKKELDEGNAVILGLVYVDWRQGFQLWNNHQVLAYRYTDNEDGTHTSLYLCDPNFPRYASVTIEAEKVEIRRAPLQTRRSTIQNGVKCSQWVNGKKIKDVRGFFQIPYTSVVPPRNL